MSLKVTLRELLKDGRDTSIDSKILRVVAVDSDSAGLLYTLSGDGLRMKKRSQSRYSVGDRLIVSAGEIIGKERNDDNVFYI